MTVDLIPIISLHADPASASGAAGGGGTHSYLRELLGALPVRDRHCIVLTRWSSPHLPQYQQLSAHASIIRLRIRRVEQIDKRELNSLHRESLDAAREALAHIGEDFRILHSAYWNSGLVAMDLSRERGIGFVHTVISNGLRRIREGAALRNASERIEIERQVFSSASRIFAVSAAECRDLVELYGVEVSKIVVVGRPVDLSYRFPAHNEAGYPRDPLRVIVSEQAG